MVWMPYFYNRENALNPLQGSNKLLFIPSYFKTINIANIRYFFKPVIVYGSFFSGLKVPHFHLASWKLRCKKEAGSNNEANH